MFIRGFALRMRGSSCSLAFAAAVALVFLVLPAGNAQAAGITQPADGSVLSTGPSGFAGSASPNSSLYSQSVGLSLEYVAQTKVSNGHGGFLQDQAVVPAGDVSVSLDGAGDWNAQMADIGHRTDIDGMPGDPYLPDGTPLKDGKYRLVVLQVNHATGDPLNPLDPAHNRWVSTFRVDHQAPDTVIDTATPPAPTKLTDRSFSFHAEDANPLRSSGTTLDCRLDGGTWNPCDDPASDPGSPTRTGHYEATGLAEGVHGFQVRATDAGGNTDPTPAGSTWLVDRTAPEIVITKPSPRERFTLGQNVPANFSCSDPLAGLPPGASGIKTCHGPARVNTSHLGNFVYSVEAVDEAGNASLSRVAYAVDPPRYNSLIDTRHPIAYYRLGDPVGATRMTDSSGNHHNGEYKNNVSLRRPPAIACQVRPHPPYTCDLNADPRDWSAAFPARDGYGFTNNVPAPRNAYTWEAWINRFDDDAGSIAGQGGAGQLFVTSDGKLALRQTQDTVYSTGPVLVPHKWWHVAATWDGRTTRLYVNGHQVGFSSSANKAPSGTGTLYVGYGDQAPWFHGSLDEVAYYGSALPGSAFATRYEVGTAHDVPGPVDGPPIQRPSALIDSPVNGGLYAHGKVPPLSFQCDDLDGSATVVSCKATVDGVPATDGSALPDGPGSHSVTVSATDDTGLTRSHTHSYSVKPFVDIYLDDNPLVYYRLGDAGDGPMADSGSNHIDGVYKNAQDSGPVGISGDGDHARRFFGSSGYGYANNIQAPRFQSTLEVWADPDDSRRQSIVGQGDAGEIFVGEDGVLSYRHMGVTVNSSVGLTPGHFTQVVGVWDGSSIMIYVNGQLTGQTEATRRPNSSSTFYVGYGEIQPWFKGSLDEVAYYGAALSPDRILQHFLADPPPSGVDSSAPLPGSSNPGRGSSADTDAGTAPGPDYPSPAVPPSVTSQSNAPLATSSRASSKLTKARKKKKRHMRKRSRARCHRIKHRKRRRHCIRRHR